MAAGWMSYDYSTLNSVTSYKDDKQAWMVVFREQTFFLTLKTPITTAADDIHKYFSLLFREKLDLMFQVNPLLGRGFT